MGNVINAVSLSLQVRSTMNFHQFSKRSCRTAGNTPPAGMKWKSMPQIFGQIFLFLFSKVLVF